METITFNCRTITPLFSRSMKPANGNKYEFELRPQSIKGVMRFWTRALIPLVIDINKYGEDNKKYLGLKKLEELIFGSQDVKSPFSIFVSYNQNNVSNVVNLIGNHDYYLKYALFGMYQMGRNGSNFSYLDSDSNFKIEIKISKRAPNYLRDYLTTLMNFISKYGGFGAKSRNGFGSFELTSNNLNSNEILKKSLSFLIGIINTDGNFSRLNRITRGLDSASDFPTIKNSFEKVFDLNFNSWQRAIFSYFGTRNQHGAGEYLSQLKLLDLRKYRKPDDFMNVMRGYVHNHGQIPNNLKIRTSITGLPLIYQRIGANANQSGQANDKFAVDNIVEGKPGRKASPLFLSVHKKENGKYLLRLLVMASKISEERTENDDPVLMIDENINQTVIGNENYRELKRIMEG